MTGAAIDFCYNIEILIMSCVVGREPQQQDDDNDDDGPPPLEPINTPITPAINNPATPAASAEAAPHNPAPQLPTDATAANPTNPTPPPAPAPQPAANQDDNNNNGQQQFMTFGFDVIIPGPGMNAEMMEEMAAMNEEEQQDWMDEQLLFEDEVVDMGMENNPEGAAQFAQMLAGFEGVDGQNLGIPPQFAQMFAGFNAPQPTAPNDGNAAPNANVDANANAGGANPLPPPPPPFAAQFTQMFGGFGAAPTGPAGTGNNPAGFNIPNGFQMFGDFLPPPATGADGAVPTTGAPVPPPGAAGADAAPGANPAPPPNPFADLLRGFGIPLIIPGVPHTHNAGPPRGVPRTRPPREKKAWTLPPAPGMTLRQRVERKEREAGLRCYDVSCGVGPSDDEPSVPIPVASMKQISIRTQKSANAAPGTGEKVCEHTFHPSCLVSAERVLLAAVGAEETVENGEVAVSCPVCRAEGCVSKEEWEEGVQALL